MVSPRVFVRPFCLARCVSPVFRSFVVLLARGRVAQRFFARFVSHGFARRAAGQPAGWAAWRPAADDDDDDDDDDDADHNHDQ